MKSNTLPGYEMFSLWTEKVIVALKKDTYHINLSMNMGGLEAKALDQ